MKSALLTTVFDAIFGRLGLHFDGSPLAAPKAGTKRALEREAQSRKARAVLYTATPTQGPSRQAMRHAGRVTAKAEASRLKAIARRERIKAKRERAKAKAPLAKAA